VYCLHNITNTHPRSKGKELSLYNFVYFLAIHKKIDQRIRKVMVMQEIVDYIDVIIAFV
jgi:hypothetical protein